MTDYKKLICEAQNAAYEHERQAEAQEATGDCGCTISGEVAGAATRVGLTVVLAAVGIPS